MSHRAFVERYGPWALVAGASEGLGAAFAGALARRGLDLVLLARRQSALDELAESLRHQHSVRVRTLALDLAATDLQTRIETLLAEATIGTLIYNAAYSPIGPFVDQSLEDKLKAIDVNCRGPLILTHCVLPPMVARGRGGVILLSSMAGRQGSAMVATYAATKAFDWVLAEGLWDELSERGVDVLACCAGATQTPNYQRSKPQVERRTMAPEAVAEEALASLGRTPSMVPGRFNRLAAAILGRLLPRRTAVRLMGRATRQSYGIE